MMRIYGLIIALALTSMIPGSCGAQEQGSKWWNVIQCTIDQACYQAEVRSVRQDAQTANTFNAWEAVYFRASELGLDTLQRKAIRKMKRLAKSTDEEQRAIWYAMLHERRTA